MHGYGAGHSRGGGAPPLCKTFCFIFYVNTCDGAGAAIGIVDIHNDCYCLQMHALLALVDELKRAAKKSSISDEDDLFINLTTGTW